MSQPGTGDTGTERGELEAPFDDNEELMLVNRVEWVAMKRQVAECHRIATELEAQLKPALATITSGNFSLSSLLFGGKQRR